MLEWKSIVENPDRTKKALKDRGKEDLISLVDRLVQIDENRRQGLTKVEALKHQRNLASQEIAKLKKEGADATEILEKMKLVSQDIKSLDLETVGLDSQLEEILLQIPNLPDDSVPKGLEAKQNRVVRVWGEIPKFKFDPKSHFEIGEHEGIIDFKKAGEVSGARFTFLKGKGARLEHALIQFMLHENRNRGYEEIIPPYIVNRDSLIGTGQLPKFEEDLFKLQGFEYFLIPTAEVPVTNYHRHEILEENQLPKKYVAHTPCFRSEAGSYGKDTKGLKRQHQFNKVELVQFVHPDKSSEALEQMCGDAENILQKLNLPYRVLELCTGDMGFSAARTYDLEVWSPFEKGYVEISSVSNCRDFQARRASIRYRDLSSKKVQFVHTLNGSSLAVGRTLLAVLENFQNEQGGFTCPPILSPYLH